GLPGWDGGPPAPQTPADPGPLPAFYLEAFSDPTSIPGLVVFNSGGYLNPGEADTRAAHAAEIGAAGGITNARGLANMYAPLAGSRRGALVVADDTLARMARTVSATRPDATVLVPSRVAAGDIKATDNRPRP